MLSLCTAAAHSKSQVNLIVCNFVNTLCLSAATNKGVIYDL